MTEQLGLWEDYRPQCSCVYMEGLERLPCTRAAAVGKWCSPCAYLECTTPEDDYDGLYPHPGWYPGWPLSGDFHA